MVVSSGNVPYRLAQGALDQLQATGCPVLGAVLNMVDQKNEKYYYRKGYYSKGYYQKYYGDSGSHGSRKKTGILKNLSRKK